MGSMRNVVAFFVLLSISASAIHDTAMVRIPVPDGAPVVECPITLPNSTAPDEILNGPTFGDDTLVAGVAEDGVMVALRANGTDDGWSKHGWVRHARGQLQVTAHPIGGQDTVGQFSVVIPDGYGEVGYQVTSMSFTVEGCWEITGSIPGHSVTIVLWVVFVDDCLEPSGTPPDVQRWRRFA